MRTFNCWLICVEQGWWNEHLATNQILSEKLTNTEASTDPTDSDSSPDAGEKIELAVAVNTAPASASCTGEIAELQISLQTQCSQDLDQSIKKCHGYTKPVLSYKRRFLTERIYLSSFRSNYITKEIKPPWKPKLSDWTGGFGRLKTLPFQKLARPAIYRLIHIHVVGGEEFEVIITRGRQGDWKAIL